LSALFFCSGVAVADTFSEAQLTPDLKFEAHLENGGVVTSWEEWNHDFMWYKLSRSQSNANPIYPEDGAIFWSTVATETTFFDVDPPHGKSFYRVCAITHAKERFCSNVVAISNVVSIPEAVALTVQSEPTVAQEDTVCAQVVTLASNPETGECREFSTPCDVPENWSVQTSCGDKSIVLSVTAKEGMVSLSWETKGGLSANGFQIVKSQENKSPSFPPAEEDEPNVWLMAGNRAFTDDQVKFGKSYTYRICEYLGKNECGIFSNAVTVFISSESGVYENPEITFSDVDESTEMGSAILQFAREGVAKGFEDGTFRPEKSITRAELAKITALATGRKPKAVTEPLLCDVDVTEWYAPYVHFFVENGFAKGFENGTCELGKTFAPHNPVKRNEAIKMILEVTGNSLPEDASDWFLNYFTKAVAMGVVSSEDREGFDEMREATRGEVMLFLSRISQK